MAKNNYDGIEVYVSKLTDGTTFKCANGEWNGRFIIEDGVPKMYIEDSITTIHPSHILNIHTDFHIPREAYVYDSVWKSYDIKFTTDRLKELNNLINNEILTNEKLDLVIELIESSIKSLQSTKVYFENYEEESYKI